VPHFQMQFMGFVTSIWQSKVLTSMFCPCCQVLVRYLMMHFRAMILCAMVFLRCELYCDAFSCDDICAMIFSRCELYYELLLQFCFSFHVQWMYCNSTTAITTRCCAQSWHGCAGYSEESYWGLK
jgi:hypothetical protein